MAHFTLQLISNSSTEIEMFIKNLKSLTNYDIIKIANELKISNFTGVFMRDTLPSKQII